MKVIFTQDVSGKGRRGDIKNVPSGYAENFLIRFNKAKVATKASVSKLKAQKHAEARDEAEDLQAAKQLKQKIENGHNVVELSAKCGKDGRLFGSVTSKQIVKAMQDQHQIKLNKHKLHLPEPIKALGYVNVPVRLHKKVTAEVRVHIAEKK